MKMDAQFFERYSLDLAEADAEVRSRFGIPDNAYYTVTTWPPERAGEVFVDGSRTRAEASRKISKSDQR